VQTKLGKTPIRRRGRTASLLSLLAVALLAAACQTLPPNSLAIHDSSRWEEDIARLEARSAERTPPANPIVFVGSSSIRLWTNLNAHFPGLPVVNLGFGGSQLADVCNYADRLIAPYRPRQVVIYGGGNDINACKKPEAVFGDFVALVTRLRAALPEARLSFISVGVSPSRWQQAEKVMQLNRLIEPYCRRHQIDFINVVPLMLGPDGLPKPDIYVNDRLHLNEKGYTLWRDAVSPFLQRDRAGEKEAAAGN